MQVQNAGIGLSAQNVQEAAAVKVQSMNLNSMKEQSVALTKLINSAPVADPNLGKNVDVLA